MNSKELKSALSCCPQEVLIDLLARLYRVDEKARKEIDLLLRGPGEMKDRKAEVIECVQNLSRHSAGEVKALLSDYMKAEKDKKTRIEALYCFIEAALAAYSNQECDHRMIMFASASYGKAINMMDQELWNTFFERSYSIAERFYSIPMEACLQAVRYYQGAKKQYS